MFSKLRLSINFIPVCWRDTGFNYFSLILSSKYYMFFYIIRLLLYFIIPLTYICWCVSVCIVLLELYRHDTAVCLVRLLNQPAAAWDQRGEWMRDCVTIPRHSPSVVA